MPMTVPSTRLRRQAFGCGPGASQDSRNSEQAGVVCLLGDTVLRPKARKPGPKMTFPKGQDNVPAINVKSGRFPPSLSSLSELPGAGTQELKAEWETGSDFDFF